MHPPNVPRSAEKKDCSSGKMVRAEHDVLCIFLVVVFLSVIVSLCRPSATPSCVALTVGVGVTALVMEKRRAPDPPPDCGDRSLPDPLRENRASAKRVEIAPKAPEPVKKRKRRKVKTEESEEEAPSRLYQTPDSISRGVSAQLERRGSEPNMRKFYTTNMNSLQRAIKQEFDGAGNRDPAMRPIGTFSCVRPKGEI